MKVFVDTSAFLSILDRDDRHHEQASAIWLELLGQENTMLYCTNYVLLESTALIQRRLGLSFMKSFQANAVPVLTIKWVDERLHEAGLLVVLAANRRQLSLVDCVSFAAMRELSIEHYFAFDQHFDEQGFTTVAV
jgi:predicted nucleic acid-binding protein